MKRSAVCLAILAIACSGGIGDSADDPDAGQDDPGDPGDPTDPTDPGDPIDGTGTDGAIFVNGWELRSETGCTLGGLLDGSGGASATSWNDFGPSFEPPSGPGLCDHAPPVAEIVTAERHDGNRALRVNFEPDGSQNGPDFRIGQGFGDRAEVYVRWWIKYSDNWVWSSADHKLVIVGDESGGQNVYFNVRGNGRGGNGRVVIHVIPADTLFEDVSTNMAPGVWHLCELRVVAGPNGRVDARLDGTLLTLTNDGGDDPSNVDTGPAIGYVKLDTTYNDYAYPSSLGLHMTTWYDSVAVGLDGWIGGE